MTTKNGVSPEADIAGGETVIQAMGMGKQAAQSISRYLFEKRVEFRSGKLDNLAGYVKI